MSPDQENARHKQDQPELPVHENIKRKQNRLAWLGLGITAVVAFSELSAHPTQTIGPWLLAGGSTLVIVVVVGYQWWRLSPVHYSQINHDFELEQSMQRYQDARNALSHMHKSKHRRHRPKPRG